MTKSCKYVSGGVKSHKPASKLAKGTFFSLLLAACTASFTACNNEESLPPQGNPLQLSFGVNAPESRAIHKDATLPDNSPVGVKLDGYADYHNLVYTGTTSGSKQSWSLSQGSVTLTDAKGTLYAYWPYSSTTSIEAIDVDMTVADQTDWLYATPVTGICEDKAEAAVTMNHAAANINVTINKGTYLGSGAISNMTVQSDGIALGGTFNAAQATPNYTAFEDEGKPLSRNLTTTTGAATDIMVVPTGTSAAITFTATIDDIQFTATSAAVTLEKGNSYVYTLNLSDISTYMTVGSFGVTPWSSKTGGNLELTKKPDNTIKVYGVSATNALIDYNTADATAKGVAIVAGEHRFMIAKKDATDDGSNYKLYWSKNYSDLSLTNYSTVDETNSAGYFPMPDGSFSGSIHLTDDFTAWTAGALSDFNGKANTEVIATSSSEAKDMCKVLESFNDGSDNQGHNDWYVPSAGQLSLIVLNLTEINSALSKIGGTVFERGSVLSMKRYWSSSEYDIYKAWVVDFYQNYITAYYKDNSGIQVRFVRDIN